MREKYAPLTISG